MTPIPERILEEAREIAVTWAMPETEDGCSAVVASALLAAEQRGREMEREECAEIAAAQRFPELNVFVQSLGEYAAKQIAAAIRSRSEEPKP